MTKNINKVTGGRRGQAQGEGFENEIITLAQRIPADNFIVKLNPSAKYIKAKGGWTIVGRAVFDFIWFYEGYTFSFDAKSTENNNTWSLAEKFDHELKNLARVSACNRMAFFMLEWRVHNAVQLVFVDPDSQRPFKVKYSSYPYSYPKVGNWLQQIAADLLALV